MSEVESVLQLHLREKASVHAKTGRRNSIRRCSASLQLMQRARNPTDSDSKL